MTVLSPNNSKLVKFLPILAGLKLRGDFLTHPLCTLQHCPAHINIAPPNLLLHTIHAGTLCSAEGSVCITPEIPVQTGSSACSGHGVLQSGKCACNPGYTGSTCRYRMVVDIDYHGTDLPDSGTSLYCNSTTCCADKCDAYPGGACKMWVWWDLERGAWAGSCFLKSAVPTDVHEEAHLITGVPTSYEFVGERVKQQYDRAGGRREGGQQAGEGARQT